MMMAFSFQYLLVGVTLVIAVALAVFFIYRATSRRASRSGCDCGTGCGAPLGSRNTSNNLDPRRLQINVMGMHCANCSSAVERALSALPFVEKATVDHRAVVAEIVLREPVTPAIRQQIADAITAVGFSVR